MNSDESGYTYDMRVFLGKDSHSATDDMLRTQNIYGQYLFIPKMFYDLGRGKKILAGQYGPVEKDMPCDFGPKQLKLKRGEVRAKNRGGWTVLVWKDR